MASTKLPKSVTVFLSELLKSEKRVIGTKNTRLIDSYAAGLVHGVTGGKVITAKHFLLAIGLHNITGSKKVIEITNKLGHLLD